MKCIHITTYNAIYILFSLTNFRQTQMADILDSNSMDVFNMKDQSQKNITTTNMDPITPKTIGDSVLRCDSNHECNNLQPPCIECNYNNNCIYGEAMNVNCHVNKIINCKGHREFQRTLFCRYCYQTETWEHSCEMKAYCDSKATVHKYYRTNCTVNDDILCLGHRTFFKNIKCNWTSGYRWSTAMILSITLGGFGADRFYLGHWQEGIGKLFSFGGLGVWTLVDVILISLHYLGPADGSLYI